MSKTSGFRTIEFKEVNCTFAEFHTPISFKVTQCVLGMLYCENFPTNYVCPKCKGTGIVEKVESKLE